MRTQREANYSREKRKRDYYYCHYYHQDRMSAGQRVRRLLWLLVVSLQLVVLSSQARALEINVAIPDLVKLNDAFWLNCSHSSLHQQQQQQHSSRASGEQTTPSSNNHFSGGEIYSIKWYKDDEEFYRFLPNAEPKVSFYETNGIQLDQTKSQEGNVLVSKADVNSEGNYKCEIVSEAPLFETLRKSKHLKIYALPVRGPRIEILDTNGKVKSPKAQEISYSVGDKIELRCNSAPSKPVAKLRWFLNEQELFLPTSAQQQQQQQNSSNRIGQRALPATTNGASNGQALLNYDVRMTPIEYRQHYKAIYSSHSTLSLVLQKEHLTNSRISFKCLASMRQEIPVASKQLIVLLAGPAQSSSPGRRAKRRLTTRQANPGSGQEAPTRTPKNNQPARHRAHLQTARPGVEARQQQQQQQNRSATARQSADNNHLALIQELESKSQLVYIYEDSDSSLGPSVIDSAGLLDKYLQANSSFFHSPKGGGSSSEPPSHWERGDNLDMVQYLRDKQSRQRILPSNNLNPSLTGRRSSGSASFVKSPLYLDEYDQLRPIINWPPLESGRLMLLPPQNSIVAVPSSNYSSQPDELKFVPPRLGASPSGYEDRLAELALDESTAQVALLERLVDSLNCTCMDGSIDTKLAWVVNEAHVLSPRDTRLYATRISPDHRQTWLTIGMMQERNRRPGSGSSNQKNSLPSILEQYYSHNKINMPEPLALVRQGDPADRRQPSATSTNNGMEQQQQQQSIKFMCQALHSMLLFSSSEMITFDFNPPPADGVTGIESNSSQDRFSSLPSNVIQATQASQSSSAGQSIYPNYMSFRSHLKKFYVTTVSISTVLIAALQIRRMAIVISD